MIDWQYGAGFFTCLVMVALSFMMAEVAVEKQSEIIYKQIQEKGIYVYPDSRIIKCEVK